MADKTSFDLASILGSAVSNSDTQPGDQLLHLDIDRICADTRNFYSLTGIDELAANIKLIGLQQPLRVRPGDDGKYTIVSGHRRCAALRQLVDEGKEQYRQVPCLLDSAAGSEAMQELRLIYANSDTRRMSSADVSQQAERVEALLYQLKEEGMEFPGKMRAHVAEACKVSESKLARLKVIRENLIPLLAIHWKTNGMSEDAAYAYAQLPPDTQKTVAKYAGSHNPNKWQVEKWAKLLTTISSRKCPGGHTTCNYVTEVMDHMAAHPNQYNPCEYRCCALCDKLPSCKDACPKQAQRAAQLKADNKAAAKAERDAKAAAQAEVTGHILDIWQRTDAVRQQAKKTWNALAAACGETWHDGEREAARRDRIVAGAEKLTEYTFLPFKYTKWWDVAPIIAVADGLSRGEQRVRRVSIRRQKTAHPPTTKLVLCGGGRQ